MRKETILIENYQIVLMFEKNRAKYFIFLFFPSFPLERNGDMKMKRR